MMETILITGLLLVFVGGYAWAYRLGYSHGRWDTLVKEWDEKLGVKR